MKHYCEQCGKEMGSEWLLGPVCGKCVRKLHAKATGSKLPTKRTRNKKGK